MVEIIPSRTVMQILNFMNYCDLFRPMVWLAQWKQEEHVAHTLPGTCPEACRELATGACQVGQDLQAFATMEATCDIPQGSHMTSAKHFSRINRLFRYLFIFFSSVILNLPLKYKREIVLQNKKAE